MIWRMTSELTTLTAAQTDAAPIVPYFAVAIKRHGTWTSTDTIFVARVSLVHPLASWAAYGRYIRQLTPLPVGAIEDRDAALVDMQSGNGLLHQDHRHARGEGSLARGADLFDRVLRQRVGLFLRHDVPPKAMIDSSLEG